MIIIGGLELYKVLSILIIIVCLISLVGTLAVGFRPKDEKYGHIRSFSILGMIYLVTIVAAVIVSFFVIMSLQ